MLEKFNMRTSDMPVEMQSLLQKHPRESWEAHPGFKDRTRHWLGAHNMFRQLSAAVRNDAELFLDGNFDALEYARMLSHRGGALVGNLHGHHGWEDRAYFPELAKADPRFEAGLEILEKDHEDLDVVLESFVKTANHTIKLAQSDASAAPNSAGQLRDVAQTIEIFLARHLGDEEELAVPIILQHRLRG